MAKPSVTFADPRVAVLSVLSTVTNKGVKLPDQMALPTNPTADPYVLIAHDATFPRYPVDENVTIRVTVFDGSSESFALAYAQTVRALLLSTRTVKWRSIHALTGPTPSTDRVTGFHMASFTVSIHMAPVNG